MNSCSSCSVVQYNDVNEYKGAVILKISHDSVGEDSYTFLIKYQDEYSKIRIHPDYAALFKEGDTIK